MRRCQTVRGGVKACAMGPSGVKPCAIGLPGANSHQTAQNHPQSGSLAHKHTRAHVGPLCARIGRTCMAQGVSQPHLYSVSPRLVTNIKKSFPSGVSIALVSLVNGWGATTTRFRLTRNSAQSPKVSALNVSG